LTIANCGELRIRSSMGRSLRDDRVAGRGNEERAQSTTKRRPSTPVASVTDGAVVSGERERTVRIGYGWDRFSPT